MIAEDLDALAVDIDSVVPSARNPRRGNVDKIATSLERLGQYRPIVVNRPTNEILAGNHTWRAAKQLGWTKIACTYVDVNEDIAVRIALVDNRLNDVAVYDNEELLALLRDTAATPDALDGTGWTDKDIKRISGLIEGEVMSTFDERYEVVIECDNEEMQNELLRRLDGEGFRVRAIIV